MRRLLAFFVVVALLAVVAFGLMVVRPSIADREARVDERWEPVLAALVPRYDALNLLAIEVGATSDEPRDVVEETSEAIAAWTAALQQGTEDQVVAANRLEGLAARFETTVSSSPRLSTEPSIVDLLATLTATVVPEAVTTNYNDAVRRYDEALTSLTGQPVASVFGFEPRTELAPVR